MQDYSDQKAQSVETTFNSLLEGVSSSRASIEAATVNIFVQLERLGFYKANVPAAPNGGMQNAVTTPRERTALEALEYQAVALRNEANRLENICYLLNNQF